MRKIFFSFAAAFCCILVVALIVEGYARLVVDDGMDFHFEMWKYAKDIKTISHDPLIGHRHAPNREAILMGVHFQTNSMGLRGSELSYERTPGVKRIVLLGDSLTVGWGVPIEQTFSWRIGEMYRDQGLPIEVVNTGVGNWNTIQEVQYFFTEAYKYRPDVVVLNFFANDAEPISPERTPSWFTRNCYSCVFLTGRSDTLLRQLFGKTDFSDYYLGLYGEGETKGWLEASAAIKKLSAYCRANGISLLIANLPELHNVQNYPFDKITALVKGVADKYGDEFLDLLPYLEDEESSKLWVTRPDPHPNGLANALIAEGLFRALQPMLDSK